MLSTRTIMLMTLLAIGLGSLLACRTFAGGGTVTVPAGANVWARIVQKLELNADQQAQIRGQFMEEKDHLHAVLERLHTARLSLRDAIHATDASESSVRTAAAQVAAAEADLAVERLKFYRGINPVLNPAQREKLATMEQHLDELVDSAVARLGDAPVH